MAEKTMSLKEATHDLHKVAEITEFAQLLLSGNITKEVYACYLTNLLSIYTAIEKSAMDSGVLEGIEDIVRADKIKADLEELDVDAQPHFFSTYQYVEHINKLGAPDILAHVYTRHFGDLYGGQIVKSKVPGSGAMYEFIDRTKLIEKTRAKLTDDLAPEARVAFTFAIYLFEDLTSEFNL